MYTHIFSEIRSKMNKMFETNIFVKYQFNHQYRIYNSKKDVIKTSIAVEFYKTHFNESLLVQKSEQEEFEIFKKKNYSDNDMSANPKSTNNPFENNDSGPQNVPEIIEMPDSDENKNAPNSIRIEGERADLPISMKGDLSAPIGNDLQTPRGNNLQTEKLPNLIKASQNRMNEKALQTTFDSAKKKIPKIRKHKTVAPIAAFEKPRKKRRAYDPKTFDKKKTSIVFAAKSAKTSDRIVEFKIYYETIIGFDKKK